MFFYKGKKPVPQAPVSPKAKPKAPIGTSVAKSGKLAPPKKVMVKPPPPPVQPVDDDAKAKKKKKKKKEEDESYAGMMTNWFNSIDTSQYMGTANAYLESAKAAANTAVKNYAPTSIQGALGGDVPVAPAAPQPKQPPPVVPKKVSGPPPGTTVVKKSALGGLFGVGKSAVPTKAVIQPKPVTTGRPKVTPAIPSPAQVRFDEISELSTETPLIVKLGPRVPPKPDGPVLSSAADLRKAMENKKIGGFDDEPLIKHRDMIVNSEPGPVLMEFDKLRPPDERLHPEVAPRRTSDGDGPVGAEAAYYGALADIAGMEDPLDFVERSGIDRVIHSRQFIQAIKQSLNDSKGALSPSNIMGDYHPVIQVGDRPISPSQDNMKTVAFLPPRSTMCGKCGFFNYACICFDYKIQKPTWDPLEASRRRKIARRRTSNGSADSPENSQDEGDPPNIVTVNNKPRLNPLR